MASIAMVGILVWQGSALLGSGVGRQADVSLAQLSAPSSQVTPTALVTADGASELMIRDPQLDALLAAHRQMGGATALQMPSGFLRNATFDEGKR
jgi:sigma-E factor negative regulatory protein RseA